MDTRPPVLLMHAFPLHSALFDEVALPTGWALKTPDRRGFGTRPLARDDGSIPQPDLAVLVDDVMADLDAMRTDTAILGGVSMGGYVALAALAAHPDRVAGLVLADTRSAADDAAARTHRLEVARRADRGHVDSGAELVAPLLAPAADAAVRERMARIAAEATPASIAWGQRVMAARRDTTAALAAARVPVLVLVGDQDTVTPLPFAEQMAAAAPDGELVVIPDSGHLTPAENPTAFNAVLGAWLTARW